MIMEKNSVKIRRKKKERKKESRKKKTREQIKIKYVNKQNKGATKSVRIVKVAYV